MSLDYSALAAASRPDAIRAALAANADSLSHAADEHHGGELVSTRQVSYRGHDIVVRTSYEITVDGRPFNVHLTVDNAGRVHYHGLPTRDFPSVIELVEKAIDVFGDEFDAAAAGGESDAAAAGGESDAEPAPGSGADGAETPGHHHGPGAHHHPEGSQG